jgi:uncharacterized protein (DUF1684 family)
MEFGMSSIREYLDLADYRRKVQAIYFGVRDKRIDIEQRWTYWIQARNELLGHHPQSALSADQRESFEGLIYFPYNPTLRYLVEVDPDVEAEILEIPLQTDGNFRMQRVGKVNFTIMGKKASLSLFRILGYGGGLFLPFRDANTESYQGTRYLLDTIKGADLGMEEGGLVLDFNFAYNPSCAYHPRWHCPLAPAENWLKVAIEAGEKYYPNAAKEI